LEFDPEKPFSLVDFSGLCGQDVNETDTFGRMKSTPIMFEFRNEIDTFSALTNVGKSFQTNFGN
jgi:hypothetical protein